MKTTEALQAIEDRYGEDFADAASYMAELLQNPAAPEDGSGQGWDILDFMSAAMLGFLDWAATGPVVSGTRKKMFDELVAQCRYYPAPEPSALAGHEEEEVGDDPTDIVGEAIARQYMVPGIGDGND